MNEYISIIIPAYNAAHYLENCLDSVLNQTYPNLEIVLINDGSTDNTKEIADRYQAQFPKIIHVIHVDNQGVTQTRFTGILASHGEWIGFVDADDEVEPDMYERLYNNVVKYGADISHCGHITIVNGGERVHEFYNTGRFAKQNNKEGLFDLLEGVFEPSLCTKLIRRELAEQVIKENVISTTIRYNEDVLMNYYLFKAATSSVFEDFFGYHYLARPDSATRKKFNEKKVLDPVQVYRQILEDASGEEYKDIVEKNYLTACMHAYSALYKQNGCIEKCKTLKQILKANRDKWHLMRRNDRIKLRLMMASPGLYKTMYRWYANHLQKKQYE